MNNHKNTHDYIIVKYKTCYIDDIQRLLSKYDYVFLTNQDEFKFDYSKFGPGLYQIDDGGYIYTIRSFTYLADNDLVKDSKSCIMM